MCIQGKCTGIHCHVCEFLQQTLTFIYRDDVWVAKGWHDLNLSSDVNHVLIVLDLLLPNRLDSHLEIEDMRHIDQRSHSYITFTFHSNKQVGCRIFSFFHQLITGICWFEWEMTRERCNVRPQHTQVTFVILSVNFKNVHGPCRVHTVPHVTSVCLYENKISMYNYLAFPINCVYFINLMFLPAQGSCGACITAFDLLTGPWCHDGQVTQTRRRCHLSLTLCHLLSLCLLCKMKVKNNSPRDAIIEACFVLSKGLGLYLTRYSSVFGLGLQYGPPPCLQQWDQKSESSHGGVSTVTIYLETAEECEYREKEDDEVLNVHGGRQGSQRKSSLKILQL